MQLVETKVEQAQSVYASTQQNLTSFMTKVEDAKSLPETIMSLVTETKDAFTKQSPDA